MTMAEAGAEVVERLRRDAYAPHFTSVGAANLMIEAADLIERLSRERDTGVPEIKTALGIAHAALTAHNDWHLKQIEPQTIDGMEIVPADAYCDSTLYELTQDALHHVERMEAKLSAAPQPPTVSPDIVALTRERDQAREALRAARDFVVKALAELVELDDFDPSEHQLVKQIDGALAAVPAPEASDG